MLRYESGLTCAPPSVCVLSGSCSGTRCSFSTTVKVDDEGGKVTNSAKLDFSGNGASGGGSSVYKHPSGFQCTWTYNVSLTK